MALLLALGAVVLDMSGSAPRTAGSNHISTAVFAATVPPHGELCEPVVAPPTDAARVQLLIGSFGQPVPALRLRYLDAAGAVVADSQLAAGGTEGVVTLPLREKRGAAGATRVCLRVGSTKIVLGGEGGPASANSEIVNGIPQGGLVSLFYLRSGSESWWQLLPTLTRRFGLGKAPLFGDWTLPVLVLALAGVWFGAARLLLRELT
ncbi:MAG TPA: hypothetical protein VHQ87_16530 [Rhizobacter sp.]|jgi:hypothetical protein|nr:hypothetical protein [Rhizobacter sp.]